MSETGGPAQAVPGGRRPRWVAIAFGMAFPTVLTLAYFVALADRPGGLMQAVYAAGKVVQFGFPVSWVWWITGRFPRPPRPGTRGATAGLAFGVIVFGGTIALVHGALLPAGVLGPGVAEAVRHKVAAFGGGSAAGYAAMGAFYSILHSAAEEYYWRWFVFGELRHACRTGWAVAASSAGFAAHHVVILGVFLGWASPWTYALAFTVGVGGAFWAWLYQRSGSLLGPWLGHLLVDAAIFTIGYGLAF
jgi:membrane protease YdiL (CAAX protease family)